MFAIVLNLIISAQGLFAFHSLRNNHDESYRVCLKSLTDKWFDNNNFVYVFSDTNDDDISFDIPRPKIIVNPNSTGQISNKPNIISNNFVMVRGVGCMNLASQLEYLNRIGIYSKLLAPKYKFFIVNHEKPNWVFYNTLWTYHVFGAVVLVMSRNKPYEEIKWYWSNPFTAGNGCGNRSNVIEEYKCTNSPKVAALKAFRDYKSCPITCTNVVAHPCDNTHRYLLTILHLLQEKFNIQIPMVRPNGSTKIQTYLFISSTHLHKYGITQEFLIQRFVWFLPIPKQFSVIEIYFIIFQKEVWLMVAVGFGVALLLYVALVALYRQPFNINRIVFINLEILSLTLWGSYSRNPKIRAVCVFLLSYSFYATAIQTAYVSGLIRVLTIPQYEKGIKTLEELADSSIPIYSFHFDLFKQYKDSHEIIKKMLPRAILISSADKVKQAAVSLRKYNNISIMTIEDHVHHFADTTRMNVANLIFDTSLFGHFASVFATYPVPDYHFVDMLDKSITALKENGIANVFELKQEELRRSQLPQNSDPTDPQVLTMGHLYGIFVIYGIGICISCIVFVVEIVTKWYCNRKRFSSVQVLNAEV